MLMGELEEPLRILRTFLFLKEKSFGDLQKWLDSSKI